MITEDYVSFETAKLLKEKGFNEVCEMFYCKPHEGYLKNRKRDEWWNSDLRKDMTCTCPSIQMAMKWLREVYGLFIRITEDITGNVFEWSVYQKNYGCKASTYVEDSYEQACEVAIKYCLEHLIQ